MRSALAVAWLLPTGGLASVMGANQQVVLAPPMDSEPSTHDWWTENIAAFTSSAQDAIDSVTQAAAGTDTRLRNKVLSDLKYVSDKVNSHLFSTDKPETEESTIYELISNHPETSKFAEYVSKFSDIVDILNSTDASNTLFIPTNEAFEHIPPHRHWAEEYIKEIIKYHIVPGEYRARKVLSAYTLPTLHNEQALGNEPQRLRPSVGFRGAKINFYSSLVKADVKANNGVIHAVNRILVPPPVVGLILTALPSHFSSLLLAYERTDFVKFVHGQKIAGSTMFAPSNRAFEKLGPKANDFLFNNPEGRKYLSALLKYQIVPNITLYSDHTYDKRQTKGQLRMAEHNELTTLLDGASLGVDTARFLGLIVIRVNGFIDVAVHDVVSKNGVIHQVDRMPLPPRRKSKGFFATEDEVSIDELKERLDDYL